MNVHIQASWNLPSMGYCMVLLIFLWGTGAMHHAISLDLWNQWGPEQIYFQTNSICTPTVFDGVHTYPIFGLHITKCPQEFHYLEFFAGRGNLSAEMTSAQYVVRSFDILYNQQPAERGSNYMDLTHSSGFAYHAKINVKFFCDQNTNCYMG